MFEIMLLASFVLVTLGQSIEQLRAAIIYVVLNIIFNYRCDWCFLTSDLFNLYVMFEIMLLASFVLVTLGQSIEQLRAALSMLF